MASHTAHGEEELSNKLKKSLELIEKKDLQDKKEKKEKKEMKDKEALAWKKMKASLEQVNALNLSGLAIGNLNWRVTRVDQLIWLNWERSLPEQHHKWKSEKK